jgi:hypothetical protein
MQRVEQRRGSINAGHYLNMLDLYALRVARSRVVPLERTEAPRVNFIGRKPRPSLSVLASHKRSASLLTGRRVASVATTAAVALSILAAAFV